MIRTLLLLATLLAATPLLAIASEEIRYLEDISRHDLRSHPAPDTYEVRVESGRLDEMLDEMAAKMPSDMPRPESAVLKKYWSRQAGRSTLRMESDQRLPYLAKVARRFSQRYNIDLKTFFLPPEGRIKREALVEKATVKSFESQLEEARNLHLSLEFSEPTDIACAFFRDRLRIPQTDILAVDLDLDPERKLLHRIELSTADSGHYIVEIRHIQFEKGHLPQDIRITTSDGRIDDRLTSAFTEIDGFWLPIRQVRTLRRDDHKEKITLNFVDYRINRELPAPVRAAFGLKPQ